MTAIAAAIQYGAVDGGLTKARLFSHKTVFGIIVSFLLATQGFVERNAITMWHHIVQYGIYGAENKWTKNSTLSAYPYIVQIQDV